MANELTKGHLLQLARAYIALAFGVPCEFLNDKGEWEAITIDDVEPARLRSILAIDLNININFPNDPDVLKLIKETDENG